MIWVTRTLPVQLRKHVGRERRAGESGRGVGHRKLSIVQPCARAVAVGAGRFAQSIVLRHLGTNFEFVYTVSLTCADDVATGTGVDAAVDAAAVHA